jgi:tRNA (cytidine32/uridine32-2'-O)-methyltransferase
MNWNKIVENIYVILVGTEHPGNVGSVARAMKTMGLSKLILVNPAPFTKETFWLAHASEDIVENAIILDSFSQAISLVDKVYATSNKERTRKPSISIRDISPQLVEICSTHKIGLVFGRERNGLNNEELDICEKIINIPTFEVYPSLNLSQAVMIILHDLFSAAATKIKPNPGNFATQGEKTDLTNHFYRTLGAIEYFPKEREKSWNRMKTQFMQFLHDSDVKSKQIRFLHKYFKEIENFTTIRSKNSLDT